MMICALAILAVAVQSGGRYVAKGRTSWGGWDENNPDFYCQDEADDQAQYESSKHDFNMGVGCCSDTRIDGYRQNEIQIPAPSDYVFVTLDKSWEDANEHCHENFGTQLATVRDEDDAVIINGNWVLDDGRSPFWIGLTGMAGDMGWESGYPCIRESECVPNSWWLPADPPSWALCVQSDIPSTAQPGLDNSLDSTSCGSVNYFFCDRQMNTVYGYRPDCSVEPATYSEAKAVCKAHGMRMCSVEEMMLGVTEKTGCWYDAAYQWTSTRCD